MKKITKYFNMKNLIFIGTCLMFIILFFYDLKEKTESIPSRKMKIIYLSLAFIIMVILFILTKYVNKIKEKQLYKIYVPIAIVLGIIYFILSPFYTGSDEYAHFLRIYEISEGVLVTPVTENASGSMLPNAIAESFVKNANEIKYGNIKDMIKVKINDNETRLYTDVYTNTSLYNPIQYVPQLVGVSIGKIFNLGPYMLGVLGRLTNFIFYLIITTLALKILPRHKLFAMTILLSPAIFNTATTLSADAVTNATILLFISYILNLIYSEDKMKKKDYVILGILTILISIFKIVYLPLVGLLFLIPNEKYNSKKEKYISTSLMIFLGAVLSATWLNTTSKYFDVVYTNSPIQKKYIFDDLLRYVFILVRTVFTRFVYVWENVFAGNEMYASQLKMYEIIPIIFIVINIFSIFYEKKKNKLTKVQIAYVFLLILMIMGLMFTALYLQVTAQWIKIGYNIAGGLQGRYFIPIFLLGVLVLGKNHIKKLDHTVVLNTLILATFSVYLTMIVNFMV